MFNKQRIENSLWGLFIADSLAMPAHWFYKLEYLKDTFGTITGYNDAPHPHPESFMVGNAYHPDVQKAQSLGRPYDITLEHSRFYDTSYNDFNINITQRAGEHANAMPDLDERYHYHHGLKAGDNTLGAHLVRVLMRSVIHQGSYKPEHFLEGFIDHMCSGANKDPYSEIYIRQWFMNYCSGLPAELCAQKQHTVWSIGSHGGIIRPLVVSILGQDPFKGLGLALEHQQLTHRSENVASALSVLVPLYHELLCGHDTHESIARNVKKIRLIKITGEELSKSYRAHNGPGNIPKDEMWDIHTRFSNSYLNLDQLLSQHTDEEIIGKIFATACYPEHGLPLLLALFQRHGFDFKASVLANANAGGDNVHRGMILGLLAGAASTDIPAELKEGLADYESLTQEIEAFVKLIDI